MLTLEDIRSPSAVTGFRNVWKTNAPGISGHGGGKPYQACLEAGSPRRYGPRRNTPEEAAQDYCDHMNGIQATPAPQLKSAGHAKPVSSLPSSPEAVEARKVLREEAKARREGRQGFVYLAAEEELFPSGRAAKVVLVKIGHTYLDPPEARLAGLQTGNPRKLVILGSKPGSEDDEAALHARFIHSNVLGEWFWNNNNILGEFGLL